VDLLQLGLLGIRQGRSAVLELIGAAKSLDRRPELAPGRTSHHRIEAARGDEGALVLLLPQILQELGAHALALRRACWSDLCRDGSDEDQGKCSRHKANAECGHVEHLNRIGTEPEPVSPPRSEAAAPGTAR